ncbi:MAG: phage portal protein [Treponema sp.]|jgi:lambda family phage portal protein|nr:phage portal protein [Treponema sp.]
MEKKVVLLDQYGNPISKTNNRYLASGYSHSAASLTKPVFKGWNWTGGSPDDDIVANLPIIRQRSRQLTMEAPIIAGLYKTLTINTVGDGLRPEPTPDADFLGMSEEDVKNWKSSVLRLWETFAESAACDLYHRDNFYELTRLVFRAQQEAGDVFVTMPRFERRNAPFALKIQVIEADCCSDPDAVERIDHERQGNDIYGGVEISQWGNVVGYWFYTGHPLAKRRPHAFRHNDVNYPRWIFIPAYGTETGLPNVLHLMESDRPGQRRGVPIIAPVVELALTLDRYIKAEAIAAQIQAMFTLVVTSENPDAVSGEMENLEGDEGGRLTDDDNLIALGNGIVQYARPGEKVEPVNPSRPTTSFGVFIKSCLEMMGPAVGVPYELLVQLYQSSFSASQAANNVARTNFKVKRSGLVHDFCQPVYEAFMDEAVMRGWINAPGYFDDVVTRRAYTRAKWNGPGMPHIDLGKSAQNYEKLTALGYATASEATSELTGGNYYENIQERGREIAAAKAAGLPVAAAEAMTSTAKSVENAETAQTGGEQNG